MRIFDRFRSAPPARPTAPEPTQAEAAPARPVAEGLTVEMKLRGRLPNEQGGLGVAENRLAELQTKYQLRQYSGHPEEMLKDIEAAEKAVRRLRANGTN